MNTTRKRLEKLEKSIVPVVDPDTAWGQLTGLRDSYLADQAEQHGEQFAEDLKKRLMEDGPLAFRLKLIRGFLNMNGIEEEPNESLVSTMARAAGIDTSEVKTCLQEGRFEQAVLENIEKSRAAADDGSVTFEPKSSNTSAP